MKEVHRFSRRSLLGASTIGPAGLALAAWEFGSWGLPGAAAFWIAAAAAAVIAGGIGIGRLDFDLTRETTQR